MNDIPNGWPSDIDGHYDRINIPEIAPEPDQHQSHEPASSSPNEGVVALGHDRGVFYYLSLSARQVFQLDARAHTKNNLMAMASLAHYWQRTRHVGKAGVIWDSAIDDLMDKCRQRGIYNPDLLRGRGAWFDDGRTILHLGDRLVVDGKPCGMVVPGSRYVYEQGQEMDFGYSDSMPVSRSKRLMDLCTALSWDQPETMGRMLAGWLVIASVCGAMPWRPHLWISSENGGGKSWIYDNILKPVLGDMALWVQSKTTEAGIRGKLVRDARPVIFDEADTQNEADRSRIQQVLDLARQASSEDGADIIKGTQSGGTKSYRIRSCFLFSSINAGLSQAADESRTIVLTLSPSSDPEKRAASYANIQKLHAEIMTPDFGSALLARTLRLLPVIRTNAETFAQAIARAGGTRRAGDTVGVVLAGAWSLRSNALATAAQADDFVGETEWVRKAVQRSAAEPEWQRALSHLAQQRIRVVASNSRPDDVPVGELVQAVCDNGHGSSMILPRDASEALGRYGIKLIPDGKTGDLRVLIANSSKAIGEAFDRTPWAAAWKSTIDRAPGANVEKPTRFIGFMSRGVSVPLRALIGGSEA